MIKTLFSAAAISSSLLLGSLAHAANIEVNANSNDIAIKGYDPVSYFVDSKPMQGSSEFTAAYNDAIYQFSSAENRDTFQTNPEKYAPQYGGFCAFGVTKERKFDTDPTAWRISDGKLYLNFNEAVAERWNKDIPGFIEKADVNYPTHAPDEHYTTN